MNNELRSLQRGEGGDVGESMGKRGEGERELVGIRISTNEEESSSHRSALKDDPRLVFDVDDPAGGVNIA